MSYLHHASFGIGVLGAIRTVISFSLNGEFKADWAKENPTI